MLGRLILLLLQAVAAWGVAPFIVSAIPIGGQFTLLVVGIVFAVIVYLTGVLGAQVLKDVAMPGPGHLTAALVLALVVAAICTFGPAIITGFPGSGLEHRVAVLAAALLGYFAKR